MNVDAITKKALATTRFADLPVTAQISILYPLIMEARKVGIPQSLICEAMNEAGSNVTLRYFREALSVAKKKIEKSGLTPISSKSTYDNDLTTEKPNTAKKPKDPNTVTTTKERDAKADSYMTARPSNPLLQNLLGKEN